MKSLRMIASAKGYDLAEGLASGCEGGLLHLRAISQIVGRKIRVWDASGKILGVFASDNGYYPNGLKHKQKLDSLSRNSSETRIFLEFSNDCSDEKNKISENYLELKYTVSEDGVSGHWIPMVGEDRASNGNDCLFNAICQQCKGYAPDRLRTMTADVIRQKDLIVEEGFPQFYGSGIFLLGGAKYSGRTADDARILIDNSQGTRGQGHAAVAHPRGHSSHPEATGQQDSVENYSRSSTQDFPKSAWFSRREQDNDMSILLQSPIVQDGIEKLNKGETRSVVKIKPGFEIKMGLWAGGEMFSGPHIAYQVTILLQHHIGEQNNHDADVQIFTCYPEAPRRSQYLTVMAVIAVPPKRQHSDDEDDTIEHIQKKIKIKHDF